MNQIFLRNVLIKILLITVLIYYIFKYTLPAPTKYEVNIIEYQEDFNNEELNEEVELNRTARLKLFLACETKILQMKIMQYGEFWLAHNLFVGNKSRTMGCAESITYTTHADYTYFTNLEILIERWFGPISFAIFTPGYDLNTTLNAIQYVRNCLSKSDLIREYVTFHVFFPSKHMPAYLPKSEMEALAWEFDCSVGAPYLNVARNKMYKTAKNLTYPINTARNIARKAVNTHFILACDIELYPTAGLIEQFLDMIDRYPIFLTNSTKRVFALPIFELSANVKRLPANKRELIIMLKHRFALQFHVNICPECHRFPNYTDWVKKLTLGNRLFPHCIAKRIGNYRCWEPVFISDNQEPFYDERFTWEGRSDRRIQGFAMCIQDYEYFILHPAFLVHRPGIKSSNKNLSHMHYIKKTKSLVQRKIVAEYRTIFGMIGECFI